MSMSATGNRRESELEEEENEWINSEESTQASFSIVSSLCNIDSDSERDE